MGWGYWGTDWETLRDPRWKRSLPGREWQSWLRRPLVVGGQQRQYLGGGDNGTVAMEARFRDFAIPTISVKQGLSAAFVGSVLSAKDGSVWLGTSGGLNRWKNGQITIYHSRRERPLTRPAERSEVHDVTDSGVPEAGGSLFQDGRGRIWVFTYREIAYFQNGRFTPVSSIPGAAVQSVAGDSAGNLWISNVDHGLFHLVEGNLVERIPWATLGRTDFASSISTDPAQ